MPDSPDSEAPTRDPDMPDDALGLGLNEPAPPPPSDEASGAYRVLARKYRPQTFSELFGQDAMVQTLGNAIKRDRLAHAFLMTGVRGVGKTTTARLIAKALNCIGADGQGGPTIDPCGKCEPCVAIAEGRHIDVIEMDAASHTGVDDVREIIEAVRYAAVSARYKIYIIDEVHMLSKNAFNALLKTLEEPPAHVKFLFATTEVNKVPVTVLSRCQRFDLKRITPELLAENFRMICGKENVEADDDALKLIAIAAEGSARDGQSILDQAIAHADMEGDGKVTAEQIRAMLGLSDRRATARLFDLLLAGDAQAMLAESAAQYALGVEPQAMLAGLLNEVHRLTLAKVGGPSDPAMAQDAREEIISKADSLSFPMLHRLWQLLLKGHEEVVHAAMPRESGDMALLRITHAATMPDPGELAKILEGRDTSSKPQAQSNAPAAPPSTAPSASDQPGMPASFESLLSLLSENGHHSMEIFMRDEMRVIEFAPPKLTFQLASNLKSNPLSELREALGRLTGKKWELIEDKDVEAPPTEREILDAKQLSEDKEIMNSPLVKAARSAFPGAEVSVDGRQINIDETQDQRSVSA